MNFVTDFLNFHLFRLGLLVILNYFEAPVIRNTMKVLE